MKKKRSAKYAFTSSLVLLTISVSMLISSTFAWYTDSVATGVEVIRSGSLDVELLAATDWNDTGPTTWTNAELIQELKFHPTAGGMPNEALWEPGGTYQLQELMLENTGTLDLQYKVTISGLEEKEGELSEVITWKIGGTDYAAPSDAIVIAEGKLEPQEKYQLPIIMGTMDESAGIAYQNKEISGIKIIIAATQTAN